METKEQKLKRLSRARCKRYREKHPKRSKENNKAGYERYKIKHNIITQKPSSLEERRKKRLVRDRTRTVLKAGKITKKPCQITGCGDRDSMIHHNDYDNYLDIVWLCKSCHIEVHRKE